ncbi:MAG: hypothetical protein JNM30_19125 [Rhodospirillales bacterium]|nr:hypothetical protein [Rhodospirillales bacterium]
MKSAILKCGVLALAVAVALPVAPRPAGASTKKNAAIAGGIGGALLLGAVIANSQKRSKKSNTTIIYQQAPPPPPVVVAPPPPPPVAQAQPQVLPPNCQVVLQTIRVEGIPQPQQAQSIACRQPDGSWQYR